MVLFVPLVKLGFLVVNQLSGHVASRIASAARRNVVFTDFIVMPIAQFLHYTDVKLKMKVLKLTCPTAIPKLDRKKAIDVGSKALTESILITVAASIIIYEFNKSSDEDKMKKDKEYAEEKDLMERVEHLEMVVHANSEVLQDLTRLVIAIRDDLQKSDRFF